MRSPAADPGALSLPNVQRSTNQPKPSRNVTGSFLLNFLHHHHPFGLSSIFSMIFSGGQTALHCTRQQSNTHRERERRATTKQTKTKPNLKKADRLTGVYVRAGAGHDVI